VFLLGLKTRLNSLSTGELEGIVVLNFTNNLFTLGNLSRHFRDLALLKNSITSLFTSAEGHVPSSESNL